ncbi:cell wall-active antibiotic response 4TMS protein YvqF [Saccharothrix carnea]|uniref:Cell wall-active antibiotic response 4TMS protein YvqF n=1 Tax=Saccharothrix carnea TaxID=1280637 RepID=A0A2P8I819_SACCR|nr:cell wall-active antibiotic response 4TMS protein YvqF [Saccharothrix carnea]
MPDPRQMRASDADREKVAQVLQQAHGEGRLDLHELDERLAAVYAAKTYGELVPLTADLGVSGPSVMPMPLQQSLPANRIGGTPGSTVSFAFWSGVERRGEWVVPPTHTAVAFMGGVELDLTRARFAEGETTINAYALMGAVEIIVPEDITVRVDGIGFMGAFEDATHKGAPTIPGGPVVRITGFAMMGAVEVKRPKKKKLKGHKYDELEG